MINIIIAHKGNPFYLKYVLDQCKSSNPNANVILLGDKSNNKYPFIKHAMLSDYFQGASEFAEKYRHMNTTPFEFELFCYQRWFAIYEYMSEQNLKDVWCMDSDVLLFEDLSILRKCIGDYKAAMVSEEGIPEENIEDEICDAGPPLAYFTKDSLKTLLNFFIESYTKPYWLEKLNRKFLYYTRRWGHGGVCDMNQLYLWSKQNSFFNFFHIFNVNKEKYYIDKSIFNVGQLKQSENGYKKIVFNKNIPYGFSNKNNEQIKLPLIHFQGYTPINGKLLIPNFYNGRRYYIYKQCYRLCNYLKKKTNDFLLVFFKNFQCRMCSDNELYIESKYKKVRKLKIIIKGKNNCIKIGPDCNFKKKAKIKITGDDNFIAIGKGNKYCGSVCLEINGSCSQINLEHDITVDKSLSVFMKNRNKLDVGAGTSFFSTDIQNIHIGRNISIGKNCMFSFNTQIYNSDGHPIYNKNREIINKPEDICIGNHVWCGWNSFILKSVKIADGCIIGKGAVVTKSFTENNTVIAGNPAKICKKDVYWSRDDKEFC